MFEIERISLLIKVNFTLQELDCMIEEINKMAVEDLRLLQVKYGRNIWSEFLEKNGGYEVIKRGLVSRETKKLRFGRLKLCCLKQQIENSFLYW